MEIVHHIQTDHRRVTTVAKRLGLASKRDKYSLTGFEISESDQRWPAAALALQSTPQPSDAAVHDRLSTAFNEQERAAADLLQMTPMRFAGFPEPWPRFAEHAYKKGPYCEPDQFFVTPDAWSVFEGFGIKQPAVLDTKGNTIGSVARLQGVDFYPCTPPRGG